MATAGTGQCGGVSQRQNDILRDSKTQYWAVVEQEDFMIFKNTYLGISNVEYRGRLVITLFLFEKANGIPLKRNWDNTMIKRAWFVGDSHSFPTTMPGRKYYCFHFYIWRNWSSKTLNIFPQIIQSLKSGWGSTIGTAECRWGVSLGPWTWSGWTKTFLRAPVKSEQACRWKRTGNPSEWWRRWGQVKTTSKAVNESRNSQLKETEYNPN